MDQTTVNKMPSKKEQCQQIMLKFFGPATARLVDRMAEEECVSKCRAKALAFFGEEKAKIFDNVK